MKNTQFIVKKGLEVSYLRNLIPRLKANDARWNSGKVFGFVYHPGTSASEIAEEYFTHFMYESTLNPSAFPSLRKFEKDIVSISRGLLNGNNKVAGSVTSGGTESIFLSLKVAREIALEKHGHGRKYEVILPETIHPAFLKACTYLSLEPVIVKTGSDRRAVPAEMERAITENTILICASAPCYPYGVVDPVSILGEIAVKRKLLFHVDACMGGFMLPFLEKLGYRVPVFDFRVPGVTSISLDPHKYAYSPKGVSVLLFRNRSHRKKQFFVETSWPGGIFASTTFMGTKSGGPLAACWAVMNHLGEEGYCKLAGEVMECTRTIREGIVAISGLEVISDPDMSVLAFRSNKGDIFNIGDALASRGWHLASLQFPDALHLTVSSLNVGKEHEFLKDLRDIVNEQDVLLKDLRNMNRTVKVAKKLMNILPAYIFEILARWLGHILGIKPGGKHAALYGLNARLPERKNINKLILNLLDGMN